LAAAGFLAFKFLPINDGSANKSLVELKEEQGQQSAPKSEAVEQILTLEESLNAEERELLQQLRDLESESESVQEADSSIRAQLAKDAPTYDDYEKLREAEANLLKGEDSNQGGQKRRSMYMPLQEEKERVLTSPAREVGQ